MPRLFIAINLPDSVTDRLRGIQPLPTPGVRLVDPGQMHLTLHYLGESDVDRITAALRAVTWQAFRLAFEGVGRFATAGNTVTLWAGVHPSRELLGLHAAIASALAAECFRPEVRPYAPHVTLARCGPDVAAHVVDGFLAANAAFSLSAVPITGFGLYSTRIVDDMPVYRREHWFQCALSPTASG